MNQSAKNALQSMWGEIKEGNRGQEIFTPPEITERLISQWGLIACDVTSPSWVNWVDADSYITKDDDALSTMWPDKSFGNPEYGNLKSWVAKSMLESLSGIKIAMLCPVRTHRRWCRKSTYRCPRVWLDPVRFYQWDGRKMVRHKNTFPAPLELVFWNDTPCREIWSDIGEVVVPL